LILTSSFDQLIEERKKKVWYSSKGKATTHATINSMNVLAEAFAVRLII